MVQIYYADNDAALHFMQKKNGGFGNCKEPAPEHGADTPRTITLRVSVHKSGPLVKSLKYLTEHGAKYNTPG
jgi:hypothetical protein